MSIFSYDTSYKRVDTGFQVGKTLLYLSGTGQILPSIAPSAAMKAR